MFNATAAVADQFVDGNVAGIYEDQEYERERWNQYVDRQKKLRQFDELYKNQTNDRLQSCYQKAINKCNEEVGRPHIIADNSLESYAERARRLENYRTAGDRALRAAATRAQQRAAPLSMIDNSESIMYREPNVNVRGPSSYYPGTNFSTSRYLLDKTGIPNALGSIGSSMYNRAHS